MARLRVLPRDYRLPGGFFVQVQMPTGTRYTIDVDYQDSVRELKKLVAEKVGRTVRSFNLILGQMTLDEDLCLNEFEMTSATVLIFVNKVSSIRMVLQLPTGSKSLEMPSNSMVSELRAEIKRQHRIKEFEIVFNGDILEDAQVLDQLDLVDNSIVTLVITTPGGLGSRRD